MDITAEPINEEDDMIKLEDSMGNKVTSQHVKKAGNLKVNALLGSTMKAGEYLVFAYFDCIQIKINGNKKVLIKKKEEGRLNIDISVPNKPGKYEMQFFFVPSPYEKLQEENFAEYSILASQKQTVYVE